MSSKVTVLPSEREEARAVLAAKLAEPRVKFVVIGGIAGAARIRDEAARQIQDDDPIRHVVYVPSPAKVQDILDGLDPGNTSLTRRKLALIVSASGALAWTMGKLPPPNRFAMRVDRAWLEGIAHE